MVKKVRQKLIWKREARLRLINKNEVVTLIKIQMAIRSYLASKKVSQMREFEVEGKFGKEMDPNENNYDNPQVRELEQKLGRFDYGEGHPETEELEFRGMRTLENGG
jgi:hypothetical protein